MTNIFDKHAPLKTRTVTDKPAAPWMTATVKEAKAERRRAEKTWRASKLTVHRVIFKQCNSEIKNLISAAKWAYYNKQIDECLTSKSLFNVMKIALGKSDDAKCNLPKSINVKELHNSFGNFFSEKIANIRKKLDVSTYDEFDGESLTEFRSVTKEEIRGIVKSSPAKSCCLDQMPPPLLITHLESVLDIITAIINDSLKSGTVPDYFKHAVVIPLLKKQNLNPDEFKNYRPVSNLPFLSKILEKAVLMQ
ncbi:RNA-directed DNA polymerase from mobile element jockey [Elysia marginata]|uniref:RNA-directed DNA polymerase from mobile element jockey n=1 Tax=Elysia marginata TaxID=1093978 RepID=A0AAV4J4T4_9GAST|nr:RNA-directed DNA polymerase from mobile element jockey [Elysia marginata]